MQVDYFVCDSIQWYLLHILHYIEYSKDILSIATIMTNNQTVLEKLGGVKT